MGKNHLPDSPEEQSEERESTDFPGTPFGRGDTVSYEEPIAAVAQEKDSVSGGVIQEPAWPAPERESTKEEQIVNRVMNLRTMAQTNQAITNHLEALGLLD